MCSWVSVTENLFSEFRGSLAKLRTVCFLLGFRLAANKLYKIAKLGETHQLSREHTIRGAKHARLHILFLSITYHKSRYSDAADGADDETRKGGCGRCLCPSEAQDGLEETLRVSAFGLC